MSSLNSVILPNGLQVYQHNNYETDFVYNEIFEQRVYSKHGIILSDNAIVLDVGANIGLFALYVKEIANNAIVHSFEPSPENGKLFTLNTSKYNEVYLHLKGLGDKNTTTKFTYYPGYSIMSGFYANSEMDKEILSKSIIEQMQKNKKIDSDDLERTMEVSVMGKLDSPIIYNCEIITLSSFIHENKINQIDLLKIDAEKCEIDILNGISLNDWLKINQVVIEAHDKLTCEQLTEILNRNNFRVIQEQEDNFGDAEIYNIYAFKK